MAHFVPPAQPDPVQEVALRAAYDQAIGQPDGTGNAHYDERHQQLDADQQGDQERGRDIEPQAGQLGPHRAFAHVDVQESHRFAARHDRQPEGIRGARRSGRRSLRVEVGTVAGRHPHVSEVGIAGQNALQELVHADERIQRDAELDGVADLLGGEAAGHLGLAMDLGEQRVFERDGQDVGNDTLGKKQQYRGQRGKAQDHAAEQPLFVRGRAARCRLIRSRIYRCITHESAMSLRGTEGGAGRLVTTREACGSASIRRISLVA